VSVLLFKNDVLVMFYFLLYNYLIHILFLVFFVDLKFLMLLLYEERHLSRTTERQDGRL